MTPRTSLALFLDPPRSMRKRYALVPSDYRQPVILGWKDEHGFVGDEPHGRDGFLVLVKKPKAPADLRR